MKHAQPAGSVATSNPLCSAPMSLSACLVRIAAKVGYRLELPDINAVLGLSWMTTAVTGEPRIAHWPLYARDAFLVPGARLLGMAVRGIHPPEAARGLRDVREFGQHFDASYRPFILRALEHQQPVLAWQGWSGNAEMLWGLITGTGPTDVGFSGWVPSITGGVVDVREAECEPEGPLASPPTLKPLVRPPIQLYVVETVVPTEPRGAALCETVVDHASRVLSNALSGEFGVITGPQAYDLWAERVANPGASEQHSVGTLEPHCELARSLIEMYRSGLRFWDCQRLTNGTHREQARTTLTRLCKETMACLGDISCDSPTGIPASSVERRQLILDALKRARDVAATARNALS